MLVVTGGTWCSFCFSFHLVSNLLDLPCQVLKIWQGGFVYCSTLKKTWNIFMVCSASRYRVVVPVATVR